MGLIDRISTAVSNKIGDALFTYLQSFGGSGVNYKLGVRRLDNTSDFQTRKRKRNRANGIT